MLDWASGRWRLYVGGRRLLSIQTVYLKMKLFDSHCHLDDKTYTRDLDKVIKRAHRAGVARLMTVGVNGKTSDRAVELAVSHPEIYASVGVHPHDAGNCRKSVIDDLLNLEENPKVRAVAGA